MIEWTCEKDARLTRSLWWDSTWTSISGLAEWMSLIASTMDVGVTCVDPGATSIRRCCLLSSAVNTSAIRNRPANAHRKNQWRALYIHTLGMEVLFVADTLYSLYLIRCFQWLRLRPRDGLSVLNNAFWRFDCAQLSLRTLWGVRWTVECQSVERTGVGPC